MLFRVPPNLHGKKPHGNEGNINLKQGRFTLSNSFVRCFFISVFPRQILIFLLSRNLTTTVTFESLGYLWLTMHFVHGRRYLKRCVTNAISPESKTRGAELFALVYQATFHCILYFLGKISIQIKFWYSQLTKLRRLNEMSERPLHVIVARRGGIKRWQ